MNEKFIWPEQKTKTDKPFEKMAKKAIRKIESDGFKLGEGKTAQVRVLQDQPDICLKSITNKALCRNRANEEMKLLSLAGKNGVRVPKPLCSVETENGNDYLMMETIHGFSLADLMDRDLKDELPESFDFAAFFEELRAMVEKMHSARVFHRDLHAGNIMLDKSGKPVIIDFGDSAINWLSSEDPYREINGKGELIVYTRDEDNVQEIYRQTRLYLNGKDPGR